MKMIDRLFTTLLLLTGLLMAGACSDHDDESTVAQPTDSTCVVTVNVDVVLPATVAQDWKNAIDWAMENIEAAQYRLEKKVKLNLRYHDEDTEDLDSLARRLAQPEEGDDTCHAILGPYHSSNAQTFLNYAAKNHLPVVMPTCTSAELQRVNARNDYAWFLTESDVTQCEIMLTAVNAMDSKDVALIYSDNTYGQTFYDYFGFFAAEHGMHIAGQGIIDYAKGDDLTDFFKSVSEDCKSYRPYILVALSDPDDYIEVGRQLEKFDVTSGVTKPPMTISADVALNEKTSQAYAGKSFLGVSPVGEMTTGFPQTYKSRFLRDAYNGEAQVYDALVLIAMGATFKLSNPKEFLVVNETEPTLMTPEEARFTDYMRGAIYGIGGAKNMNWTRDGLAAAFAQLTAGNAITYTGAVGMLQLDYYTGTKNMNTFYMLWNSEYSLYEFEDGSFYTTIQITPICYMSNKEYGNGVNTTFLWEIEIGAPSFADRDGYARFLPLVNDYWAVVIATSTTWKDYRHQADALAMYQMLRQHGYDDDHIVLIMEDNLANDARNSYPGQIFVDGRAFGGTAEDREILDVRKGAKVDYRFSQLQPDDLMDIMTGRRSDRLPHVITTDSTSNVFVFWSGHGGESEGPLWGNEDDWTYFGKQRIRNIVETMSANKQYRRMMMALETCFSGKWGEELTGIPDLLVLTAASPYETSKAEQFDQQLGVFLTNAFSSTFMQSIKANPTISIYDLFTKILKATNGSHVSLYNEKNYGSVYKNDASDFFPYVEY